MGEFLKPLITGYLGLGFREYEGFLFVTILSCRTNLNHQTPV